MVYKFYVLTLLLIMPLLHGNTEKILLISPPKAGAHAVAKVVEKLTGKTAIFNESCMNIDNTQMNESFLYLSPQFIPCTHIFYNERNLAMAKKFDKVIFVKRDPRACLMSFVRLVKRSDTWKGDNDFTQQRLFSRLCSNFAIKARGWDNSIFEQIHTPDDFLSNYFSWMQFPRAHIIAFEDIILEDGVEINDRQLAALAQLAQYLQANVSREQLRLIAQQCHVMKDDSFVLNDENKENSKKYMIKTIKAFGYEID